MAGLQPLADEFFRVYPSKGGQGPWADVSFDRPYGRQSQYLGIVNDPLSVGSGEFLSFEQPMSFFLEQHGYDVTYCSNSDMLTPQRGLKCKLFLSIGHDEYWDIRQFESVTTMRDQGVNLMFLSGNSVCWVTPFRASTDGRSNRIIFRGGPYGGEQDYARERLEKHGPFPEHGPDEGLLIGARNTEPINGGGTGQSHGRTTGFSRGRASSGETGFRVSWDGNITPARRTSRGWKSSRRVGPGWEAFVPPSGPPRSIPVPGVISFSMRRRFSGARI